METLMYGSTFSWPRHWLEVSGQLHAPAALPQGEALRSHWLGGWVGPRAGLDLNLDPLIIQLVASRYTNYATVALICICETM
jgi:hypothetical protein